MYVDGRLPILSALPDGVQNSFSAWQVVCCSDVEDHIVLGCLFGDFGLFAQVAQDCRRTGRLYLLRMLSPADKARDIIAFGDKQVQDIPANKAGANDEHTFT